MQDCPRIHPSLEWTCLTREAGHHAFGYYDRQPWDPSGRLHLAVRFPQQERLPEPGERAHIGVVDAAARRFTPLAETEAWCHQQGAMTQWLPHLPGCLVYNDFRADGGHWRPVARVFDLARGPAREYPFHIYVVAPDGRCAAVLDIARNPRRGYAYARAPLPVDRPLPDLDTDGLFLADLHSGALRLVASYRAMLEQFPVPFDLDGSFVGLEHAMFNADSSRVMVLLRNSPGVYAKGSRMWRTYLYSVNVDGSDLHCTLPDIYWRERGISHQIWGRTPREILVDANWFDRGHEYVVFDESIQPVRSQRLAPGMGPMGHLIFSPDGRWLAADTYAQPDGFQRLALVDTASGALREIGRFRHQTPCAIGDMRCDLHPRWSADGRILTVDSIHAGERSIYAFETAQVTGKGAAAPSTSRGAS